MLPLPRWLRSPPSRAAPRLERALAVARGARRPAVLALGGALGLAAAFALGPRGAPTSAFARADEAPEEGAAGAAEASAAEAVARALAGLTSADVRARAAAIDALDRLGAALSAPLAAAFAHPDRARRLAALDAALLIEPRLAAPLLPALAERLADEPDPGLRRRAAAALAARIDEAPAKALGALAAPLAGALGADDDAAVRAAAADALGWLPASEASLDALAAALVDDDTGVRRAAVRALGEQLAARRAAASAGRGAHAPAPGSLAAIDASLAAFDPVDHPPPADEAGGATAGGAAEAEGEAEGEEEGAGESEPERDEDERPRAGGAASRPARADAATAEALGDALAGDEDAEVRREAARALGALGGAAAARALARAVADEDAAVRAAIAVELGGVARALPHPTGRSHGAPRSRGQTLPAALAPRLARALAALVADPAPDVRAAALPSVAALGAFAAGDAALVDALARAAREGPRGLRADALAALIAIDAAPTSAEGGERDFAGGPTRGARGAPSPSPARAAAEEAALLALADPLPDLARAVCRALAAADGLASPAFADALARRLPDPDLGHDAAWALAHAGGDGPERLARALLEGPEPARRSAAAGLSAIRRAPPAAVTRLVEALAVESVSGPASAPDDPGGPAGDGAGDERAGRGAGAPRAGPRPTDPRAVAIATLSRLGADALPAAPALARLASAERVDGATRSAALDALAAIAGALPGRLREPVVAALRGAAGATPAEPRAALAAAAAGFAENGSLEGAGWVGDLLVDGDPRVRAAVCAAFAERPGSAFLVAERDPRPLARLRAARQRSDSQKPSVRVAEDLAAYTMDPDLALRREAWRVAAACAPAGLSVALPSAEAVLARALASAAKRPASLPALLTRRTPAAPPTPDDVLGALAVLAAAGSRAASAIDLLRAGALALDDADARAAAASALGGLAPLSRGAVHDLAQALVDPSARVREEAARALGRLGEAAGLARRALFDRTLDPVFDVRLAAVEALSATRGDRPPDPAEIERFALLARVPVPFAETVAEVLLRGGERHTRPEAGASDSRWAACKALGVALASGVAEVAAPDLADARSAALAALSEALADPDLLVATQAASALPAAGCEAAVPALAALFRRAGVPAPTDSRWAHWQVRHAAGSALARAGGRGHDALAAACLDPFAPIEVRGDAAWRLLSDPHGDRGARLAPLVGASSLADSAIALALAVEMRGAGTAAFVRALDGAAREAVWRAALALFPESSLDDLAEVTAVLGQGALLEAHVLDAECAEGDRLWVFVAYGGDRALGERLVGVALGAADEDMRCAALERLAHARVGIGAEDLDRALDRLLEGALDERERSGLVWMLMRLPGAALLLGERVADRNAPPRRRALAAALLGRAGPRARLAVPLLYEAARDPDRVVRVAALTALGGLANVARPQPRRAAALVRDALASGDPAVERAAVAMLGGVRAEAGLPVAALARWLGDPIAGQGAIGALVAEGRAAEPALLRALGSRRAEVRRAAASALRRLGRRASAEAVATLAVRLAQDPDAVTRAEAARALGALAKPGDPVTERALATAVERDPHADVRAAAARALREVAPARRGEAGRALVRAACRDPDPAARAAAATAATALYGLGAPGAVASFLATAWGDEPLDGHALRRLGPAGAVFVQEALAESAGERTYGLERAAMELGPPIEVGRRVLLRARSEEVRRIAADLVVGAIRRGAAERRGRVRDLAAVASVVVEADSSDASWAWDGLCQVLERDAEDSRPLEPRERARLAEMWLIAFRRGAPVDDERALVRLAAVEASASAEAVEAARDLCLLRGVGWGAREAREALRRPSLGATASLSALAQGATEAIVALHDGLEAQDGLALLGALELDAALPRLLGCLAHRDVLVRGLALEALGLWGEAAAHRAPEIAAALAAEPAARLVAVHGAALPAVAAIAPRDPALGALVRGWIEQAEQRGEPSLQAALLAAVGDEALAVALAAETIMGDPRSYDGRYAALDLLRRIGPNARAAVPAIASSLARFPDPAARALAAIGDPAAIPALRACLRENDYVPAVAAALATLGADDPETVAVLADRLFDRSLTLPCARALGDLGPRAAAAAPDLAILVRSGDEGTGRACAAAIARMGPAAKAAVDDLGSTLRAWEWEPWRARAAARALAGIGAPALPGLLAARADPEPRVRRAAAAALAQAAARMRAARGWPPR